MKKYMTRKEFEEKRRKEKIEYENNREERNKTIVEICRKLNEYEKEGYRVSYKNDESKLFKVLIYDLEGRKKYIEEDKYYRVYVEDTFYGYDDVRHDDYYWDIRYDREQILELI